MLVTRAQRSRTTVTVFVFNFVFVFVLHVSFDLLTFVILIHNSTIHDSRFWFSCNARRVSATNFAQGPTKLAIVNHDS